jgi:hypothetical protein
MLMVDVTLENERVVEDLLRAQGFRPFEVELGGNGVGILEETSVKEEMIEGFKHSLDCVSHQGFRWQYWSRQ